MFRIVWSGFFIRWREVASISKEVRKVSYTKIKKIGIYSVMNGKKEES